MISTGTILERDADSIFINVPFSRSTRGDSQEERCAEMYRAALLAHFDCALHAHVSDSKGGITIEERARSRRLLTSPLSPWAADRAFLAECAGLDPEAIRERAIELLAPMIAAERAAERKRQETTAERQERIALVHHLALGGKSIRQGKTLKPKTAADWLTIALTTGDEAAFDRAAEIERAEHAAA
jgi:hypothetical protein